METAKVSDRIIRLVGVAWEPRSVYDSLKQSVGVSLCLLMLLYPDSVPITVFCCEVAERARFRAEGQPVGDPETATKHRSDQELLGITLLTNVT